MTVSEKIVSVNKIAQKCGLHWLLIASIDVFTNQIVYRTFYSDESVEICLLADDFRAKYKNLKIDYSIYVG